MIFRRSRRPDLPPSQWADLLSQHPFLGHWAPERLDRLRALTLEFVDRKRFASAAGLEMNDTIGLQIALQACLPVLALGLDWYDDFDGVIVYPDQFLVNRSHVDDAGVVHESLEALAGETMHGGPVIVSWADARPNQPDTSWNVVIHEFVHKLDMKDGDADGIPPLPAGRRRRWQEALEYAYFHFCDELDAIERHLPRDIDPESPEADPWYASLPFDSYAAQDPAEFFAVAGETFFVQPQRLRQSYPLFHRELRDFFGYDPEQSL